MDVISNELKRDKSHARVMPVHGNDLVIPEHGGVCNFGSIAVSQNCISGALGTDEDGDGCHFKRIEER